MFSQPLPAKAANKKTHEFCGTRSILAFVEGAVHPQPAWCWNMNSPPNNAIHFTTALPVKSPRLHAPVRLTITQMQP